MPECSIENVNLAKPIGNVGNYHSLPYRYHDIRVMVHPIIYQQIVFLGITI